MSAVKVVVNEPFSVTHDGVSYGPGETADVVESVADLWIRSGWVTAAGPVTKPVAADQVTTKEAS